MPAKTTANLLQAKSSFFCIAVTKISAAIERRRVRAALGRLDENQLKEIGIARSDIERIANRTYPLRS